MSYVPPHLRNTSSTTVAATTTTRASSATLDDHNHHHHHHHTTKLAFSSSHSHSHSSNKNPSPTPSLSNASRRSSAAPPSSRILAVPDPLFPHWQPSERVSRFNPDQVPLQSSFPPFSELTCSSFLLYKQILVAELQCLLCSD